MRDLYPVAGHTMGTPEYELYEAMDLFSSIGLDGIEIIWDDEYKCALRKDSSSQDLAELKTRLIELNLKACCLTPYMTNIDSPDARDRGKDVDDFLRCIETAEPITLTVIKADGRF
jgi:L-ribulose-5-phosphate 3-epimerase